MKLAIHGDHRLGVVVGDDLVDVTGALPWAHDPDPLTAGWWRRLCRDLESVRPALEDTAEAGRRQPLDRVNLRAPALNPSKILACASNYGDHVAEMHQVQQRTLGRVESWMMNFDVFLKSPSSLSGPRDGVTLPAAVVAAGQEIHHESELVVVVGSGGADIPEETALDHVMGYTTGLDITVRSTGDRSRRKSYDTFSPVGPWVTTADEVGDPGGLDIHLEVNGETRQDVNTSTMLTKVPAILAYASRMMPLLPGDLVFTGAPPGVGPLHAGDVLDVRISRLGSMHLRVT